MNPDSPILTIAIPTYNRPKPLGKILKVLLPQIGDDWVLHIHDNCSDSSIAEIHADLLADFGKDRVTIFRNIVNIGACANVLRCFEHCSTHWLAVVADDDEIAPDYVESVLKTIKDHPDIVFANFSSSIFTRPADFVTEGLPDFCMKIDNWSNLLFLPCGLYNRQAMVPSIRYGYHYAYSLSPHIAILLQCLKENGGRCLFSAKPVVNYVSDPDLVSWSRLNLNLMAFLLELIPDKMSRLAFFDRMRPFFMNRKTLAFQLIHRACETGEDTGYIFDIRAFCCAGARPGIRDLVVTPFLRFLVAHPRLGLKFIRMFGNQSKNNDTSTELLNGL